jgi:hypothetical protein
MDLEEALSNGKTAYLPKEGGDLDRRTLTLYVVEDRHGGLVVERRTSEYKALEPPRFLDSPEAWWMPQGQQREEVDPDDLPLDVERDEEWKASEADPDALDRDGLDTAGKALNVLRGTAPDEAAQKDPEPPFTEGFEIVEETADSPPGQSGEVKEGPPEVGSHTEHLERIDE